MNASRPYTKKLSRKLVCAADQRTPRILRKHSEYSK